MANITVQCSPPPLEVQKQIWGWWKNLLDGQHTTFFTENPKTAPHCPTLDFMQLQALKASDLSPENGSFKVDGKNPGSCTTLSQDLRTGKAGLEWGHMVQRDSFSTLQDSWVLNTPNTGRLLLEMSECLLGAKLLF